MCKNKNVYVHIHITIDILILIILYFINAREKLYLVAITRPIRQGTF